MEVSIVNSQGIANDHIVMIRAGQMRRQAKLSAGLPFQFPTLPLNANPFKVEVYKPISSKSVALSPDADRYVVRFPGSAAEGLAASKLQLVIHDALNNGAGANSVGGEGPVVAGAQQEDAKTAGDADEKRAEAAEKARAYLQKHDLVKYVQDMLSDVLKERPGDPFRYMQKYAGGQDVTARIQQPIDAKAPHAHDQDSDHDFGEEPPELPSSKVDGFVEPEEADSKAAVPLSETELWVKESHQAWMYNGEHGFLTTYVNARENRLRYTVLTNKRRIYVETTQEEFDVILDQQGSSLAHVMRMRKTLEVLVDKTLHQETEGDADSHADFGEDDDDFPILASTTGRTIREGRDWVKESHQPWHHDGIHGILTTYVNAEACLLKYSLLTQHSRITVTVDEDEFEGILLRQDLSLPRPLQMKNAIEEVLLGAAPHKPTTEGAGAAPAPSAPPALPSAPPAAEVQQEEEALKCALPQAEPGDASPLDETRTKMREVLEGAVEDGSLETLLAELVTDKESGDAGGAKQLPPAAAGDGDILPTDVVGIVNNKPTVSRGSSAASPDVCEVSLSATPDSDLVLNIIAQASSAAAISEGDGMAYIEESAAASGTSKSVPPQGPSGDIEESAAASGTSKSVPPQGPSGDIEDVKVRMAQALFDACDSGVLDQLMQDMTRQRESRAPNGAAPAASADGAAAASDEGVRERIGQILNDALDDGRLEQVMQQVCKDGQEARANKETMYREMAIDTLSRASSDGRLKNALESLTQKKLDAKRQDIMAVARQTLVNGLHTGALERVFQELHPTPAAAPDQEGAQPSVSVHEKSKKLLVTGLRDGSLHKLVSEMEEQNSSVPPTRESKPREMAKQSVLMVLNSGAITRALEESYGPPPEAAAQGAQPSVFAKSKTMLVAGYRDGSLQKLVSEMEEQTASAPAADAAAGTAEAAAPSAPVAPPELPAGGPPASASGAAPAEEAKSAPPPELPGARPISAPSAKTPQDEEVQKNAPAAAAAADAAAGGSAATPEPISEEEAKYQQENAELQASNDELEQEIKRLRELLDGPGSAKAAAATAAPTEATRAPGDVPMNFKINGLDYDRLAQDQGLVEKVKKQLRAEIGKRAEVSEGDIDISFSKGSVKVSAVVRTGNAEAARRVADALNTEPAATSRPGSPVHGTREALLMAVLGTRGIGNVISGRMEVVELQVGAAPDITTPAPAAEVTQRPAENPEATRGAPIPPAAPAPSRPRPGGRPLTKKKDEDQDGVLDFDHALNISVGNIYDELHAKNLELRASYQKLAQEFVTLQMERERMKQMLVRLCYGLEGMATDIRASVEDDVKINCPSKSSCLETENKQLRQANSLLFEANRKMRQENDTLQSEVSSREASRATSAAVTNPQFLN